jgi:hypothetical protein
MAKETSISGVTLFSSTEVRINTVVFFSHWNQFHLK